MVLTINDLVGKTIKTISYRNEYREYSQINIEFTDGTSITISNDSVYHELIINLFKE